MSGVATEPCRQCGGLGFIEFPENYVGARCPKCDGTGRASSSIEPVRPKTKRPA